VHGHGVVEDRVHDPPCGFHSVLTGEEHPVALQRSADQLVEGRMLDPGCWANDSSCNSARRPTPGFFPARVMPVAASGQIRNRRVLANLLASSPNTSVAVDRARDLPALISAEATGRIRRFSGYREWTTPEFIVDSGQPLVDVGVDGEALQLPPPLRFRSLPGALRVRTPLDAPGASPAALRPAGPWRTATALVRVVGGRPGQ
jgi:hypothetical protein